MQSVSSTRDTSSSLLNFSTCKLYYPRNARVLCLGQSAWSVTIAKKAHDNINVANPIALFGRVRDRR